MTEQIIFLSDLIDHLRKIHEERGNMMVCSMREDGSTGPLNVVYFQPAKYERDELPQKVVIG